MKWKDKESHRRTRNVMEGRRMSFPIIYQVRKVIGGIVQSAMWVCVVGYVSGL